MRLIEKIILLLLGISLLPLIIVGSLFYSSVKTTLVNETTEQLNSIATIQEHRLVDIRSQNLKRLADFTSRKQLRTLVDTYNHTNDKQAAQAAVTTILDDAKTLSQDIHSAVILDAEGMILARTQGGPRITQQTARELFANGKQKNTIKLINANGHGPIFQLSGPLMVNGQTIGVAVIETEAAELAKTVTDHTGLGETGEIQLGHQLEDGQFAYIAPHRFEGHAPGESRIIDDPALPMYRILMGEEAIFSNIRDYRGEEVFAVTRSVEDSGWGLVVKVDRAEALQPLTRLRSEIILLAFINSVLVVFTAIALARRLTQPILDIDEVAEQTSRGNLKGRIAHPSNDEIGNLAGTFNDMLDNLEVFDKAKSDFVSLASHQLRTPLTSIRWAAETLLSPKSRLTKEKQKHYLQQINASSERMIELVGSLLSVSKIDVGTLPFKKEPVQLAPILEQVLSDLDVLTRTKNIIITKQVDKKLQPISTDSSWIRVIFQNLISNAIRYSPAGQQVEIVIKQQPEDVLIRVADRGYGIPAAQQEHLFTKFFRADNAKELGSDGSGLGLYITKSMVERAGGSIWFESTEGSGSTFYVKIPIRYKKPSAREDT